MKALITGVSEGIGGAICLRLARAALARNESPTLVMTCSGRKPAPDKTLQALEQLGAKTLLLSGDLSDPQVAQRFVKEAVEFADGLDTLIANAGMMGPGRLSDLSLESWNRLFDVNVRAPWLLAQAALPALRASRGTIVAVSSMAGDNPTPAGGAYSSSKAALSMLCRQLAQEVAADGIRVNAVAPGMIHTPLTDSIYQNSEVTAKREAVIPLGRIGTPDDIAAVVAFLASPDAAYITGQVITADGGFSDSIMAQIPGLPQR
ncbi:SDR family NAD(P)-dependent oxidoreductase [Marinobacterium sedimentorum]|uniref:SDR family NAD(P)-dependent oxidoreductase n=1 Tax=Marinobacterium sedimentorum TaxID=2927804 RepID=UPI0020C5E999|nr:SDR family oxidoreductase [Marinobacterium sedimentorum]MCP8687593.1 SDR family oxidoreductase [Marinobacterium sedimentorum]